MEKRYKKDPIILNYTHFIFIYCKKANTGRMMQRNPKLLFFFMLALKSHIVKYIILICWHFKHDSINL